MALRLLLLMAVAVFSRPTWAADPTGCYAVSIAALDGSGRVDAKSVHLTSRPVTMPWGSNHAHAMIPALPADRFNYAAAYWEQDGEKLTLTLSNNGLSGTRLS